ncbi:MAG TPA: hypothetical protein V6C95_10760 [Coleofasciculaceae cyanobacterium]
MHKLSKQLILALPQWTREHLLTIRVAALVVAALALWVFAEIAEEILEKESYSFDKQTFGMIGYLLSSKFSRWRGWIISLTIGLVGEVA